MARAAVTEYLKARKKIILSEDFKSRFSYNSGVFITLNKAKDLRGCI
ncbi:MAG: AMMECR1 domain-containing protein, partial [Nitrosopumilaceae archaeon]